MPAEKAAGGRGDTMVNLVIILECFGILLTMAALLLLLNGDGAKEQKLRIIKWWFRFCAAVLLLVSLCVLLHCSAESPFEDSWRSQFLCSAFRFFLTGMVFFTGRSNGFRMHPDFIMSVLPTALCMCFFCSAVSLFPIPSVFTL